MKQTVSVIIPVYKVEKYLDACISSVVNQSYRNLEIILVDDGSPDKCPTMCDDWAKRDNRIKVIHKVNGGLSSARNAGLNEATGEYIAFLDSDDWIEKDMYKDMVEAISKYNVDFVAGKIMCYIEKDGRKIPFMEQKDRYIISLNTKFKKNDYRHLTISNMIESAAWNKLYKRDYIADSRFKECRLFEDYLFSYYKTKDMTSMYYLNKYYYNYRIRDNSICTSANHIGDWDKNFEEIESDVIKSGDDSIMDSLMIFEVRHYLSQIKNAHGELFSQIKSRLLSKKIPFKKLPLRLLIKYCIFRIKSIIS